MTRIPSSALLLGLAGLIPFLWGASSSVSLLLEYMPVPTLPPAFTSTTLLVNYGTVVLCFMAGVIWGFAANVDGPLMPSGLALSVIPALWIFVFSAQPDAVKLLALIGGFCGLLIIDYACVHLELAPPWWISLRLLLTGVVVFCLTIGFLFAA